MNKIIFIVALIPILFLISGCDELIGTVQEARDNTNIAKEVDDAYHDIYEAPQDIDIKEEAVEKGDTSICERISPEWQTTISECFAELGIKLNDETICKKAAITKAQIYQADRCFSEIAMVKKDLTLCESINEESQKAMCINRVNLALSGKTWEEYVETGLVNNNISVCKSSQGYYQINDSNRAKCLAQFAIAKDNKSFCGEGVTTYDQDNCFTWIAILKTNRSACEEVGYYDAKFCYTKYDEIYK